MALQNPTNSSSSSCLDLTISMPGFASFPSSGGEKVGLNGVMRDLDINQVPIIGEEEEKEEDWLNLYEEEESNSNSNGTNGPHPRRKKLRLSKEQARLLEETFRQNHTLNTKQKEALAVELKLRPRQVEVWFQNRRARSKLKQTEIECEYLKRWFGSLTEQNRRLQREVEELRAIKVAPPHTVFSPHNCDSSASTFTMCPACERVTTTTTAATLSAKYRL